MCAQNTQEKSQKKTKSSSRSCCPWFFGIILLLASIGGLLAWDTQRNGGVFENSAFGKILKDAGALPYVETAWTKSLSTSARGFQWAETNVPVYVNKTCVVLKPYGEFLKDLSIVGLNAAGNGWTVTKEYVVAKTPAVVSFVSVLIHPVDLVLYECDRYWHVFIHQTDRELCTRITRQNCRCINFHVESRC